MTPEKVGWDQTKTTVHEKGLVCTEPGSMQHCGARIANGPQPKGASPGYPNCPQGNHRRAYVSSANQLTNEAQRGRVRLAGVG